MRAALFVIVLAACGSKAAPPASPPSQPAATSQTARPNSIAATGTLGGVAFTLTCDAPAADLTASAYAFHAEGKFGISCSDATTGLQVNASGPLQPGDTTVTEDESVARIGVVTPPATPDEPPFDIITTSASSRADASRGQGTISISGWDEATGHVTGTATMSWAKDKNGAPGDVTIAFDLILRAPGA